MSEMTVDKVLKGAQLNLIEKGWVQGAFYHIQGEHDDSLKLEQRYETPYQERCKDATAFCLLGAMACAAGCSPVVNESDPLASLPPVKSYLGAKQRVYDVLRADGYKSTIIAWNDSRRRKKDDVLCLLDKAIALGITITDGAADAGE